MADTAYFIRRSSLFVKLRLSNGNATEWAPCADGGLMQTSDKLTIKELRAMDKAKRGGVREITAEQYEEAKKKPQLSRPAQSWQPTATPPIPEVAPKKTSPAPSAPSEGAAETKQPKNTEKPSTSTGVLDLM